MLLVGCGGAAENPSEGDIEVVPIALSGTAFAPGTPKQIEVPGDRLVMLDVRADGGPFRLSILGSSLAQTFKIPRDGSEMITLAEIKPGSPTKLLIGPREVLLVAADGQR